MLYDKKGDPIPQYPGLEEANRRSRARKAKKYAGLEKMQMPWNYLASALRLIQEAALRTSQDNVAIDASSIAVKELLARLAADAEQLLGMYDHDLIEHQAAWCKMKDRV